jgi:hypothetical protein
MTLPTDFFSIAVPGLAAVYLLLFFVRRSARMRHEREHTRSSR